MRALRGALLFGFLATVSWTQLRADGIRYLPQLGLANSYYHYQIWTSASPTPYHEDSGFDFPIALTHEVDNSAAGMASVDFLTWFNLPAGASARAFAVANGPFRNDPPYQAADAFVDVQFSMAAGLSWKKAPPGPVDTVPVTLVAMGGGNGIGDYTYQSKLDLSGGSVLLKTWTALGGGAGQEGFNDQFDLNYDIDLSPGDVYYLFGDATCSASASTNPATLNPFSSCQVGVDPMFEFDQAAFDREMGANTFPLDQYLGIQYSPNIVTPEPSAFATTGLGIMALAAMACRRRAHRPRPDQA